MIVERMHVLFVNQWSSFKNVREHMQAGYVKYF